jgi:ADP-heptose:LPS heptosyltransferase
VVITTRVVGETTDDSGVPLPDAARTLAGVSLPLADPSVRRVAVVRLRVGLGDLLCSVPALRALRRGRPDVRLTLVTWAEMAPVVARMAPYVDELLPFPGVAGIPERPPDAGAWQPFLTAAANRRFDLALQCYGNNPVANEVTAALGATRVGGFAPTGWEPGRDPALHLRYPVDLHEVWRHLSLLRHLGVALDDADPARMEFPVSAADEEAHADLLRRHDLRTGGYVVLHPGASSPSRRWPPERFAAVGDALAAAGLRVVLTGVPGERAITAAVAAVMTAPVTDLTGATTLGGLAALLRDAALLVANDTGSAHLAAAVGGRSVVVFLPGEPWRWAHAGPRHRAVRVDVGCNPCPHLDCPIDHRCATAVTAPMVVRAARGVLATGHSRLSARTSAAP